MWLVRFDNFGSVFRVNPPRVAQKSLGLPGRWLPANPLPLTRHGNLRREKASAGARSIRRMGVWVEVISCCPHAGNACLAVAPMITGCLNLNPAGRAIGRMWRGSRGVVAEGCGEGKRWVTVEPSGFAEKEKIQMDSVQRSTAAIGWRVQCKRVRCCHYYCHYNNYYYESPYFRCAQDQGKTLKLILVPCDIVLMGIVLMRWWWK